MKKDTPKIDNIKFKDWMASKHSESLESLFEMLSDNGFAIANTADDFLADGEDAVCDAEQLACDLIEFGSWLTAKVAAYHELNNIGFEGVKTHSDHTATISFQHEIGDGSFEGEWCRSHGIVYASLDGVIEVANACERGNKRKRHLNDTRTAEFLLRNLYQHSVDEAKAA